MSEQKTITEDSSRLSIMAAAVEHMSSAAAAHTDHHSPSAMPMSPSRRSKLVLPTLTPAMQQDLALAKGTGAKSSKPLSIGTRPEYTDYPLQGIVTPHPNDVLCGRGGGSNNHPGNESFRELVNEVKVPYVNCPKREKPLIARRIVEAVRNQTPPGRFLSKDTKGLWNDIGDGKGREKTSQALREGAPIIRDMIGKPTSPTNVASVLKEAKKAERAEKEYCVKLPNRQNEDSLNSQGASPVPNNEPTVIKRGTSMGSSPMVLNNSAPLPPLKKFRSFGEQDIANNSNGQQPLAAWPTMAQQPGRNFNMMPYAHMMGGFAAPPRGPVDYANGMPRYPDSVPVETVRRLLMGQLDPIQLAMQLLSPEEAAIVARRHGSTGSRHPGGMMNRGPPSGPSPVTHPLPLNPIVSDGSSTTSLGYSSQIQTTMRRTTSDQSSTTQGGDDASSVDSSKQSSDSKRALPKKKRKYIEASV